MPIRPVAAAYFLEVERWMKGFFIPKTIVFSSESADLQCQIEVAFPKLWGACARKCHASSSSNIRSKGAQSPTFKSAKALAFITSNFPASVSAFICKSHVSSSKGGSNVAINSQCSSGESSAMACWISATPDMSGYYQTFLSLATGLKGDCQFARPEPREPHPEPNRQSDNHPPAPGKALLHPAF